MRRTLTVIFAVIVLVVTCGAGWPTDHGDNRRSGSATTGAATFKKFGPGFTRTLDGAVYGSPILAGNSVIVATENNSVFALDPNTGAIKWQRRLRLPISDPSVLACPGNIKPTGITGSPAYDAATGRIFVVTVTDNPTLGVTHELWGINASNGSVAFDRRAEVPGTDPKAEQQRAALAVDRGRVYVGFGGLAGDCGNYKGAILQYQTSGAGGRAYVVPTPREGAIWAPGGPVVEPNGNLLFAVGNGGSTSGYDYSDSVTEVNPNMVRTDFFAPRSWASDNANDLDLGSMTPVMTSAGYVLQIGKSGTAYTVRIGHLGGIGGQVASGYVCPAYGVSAGGGSTVFVPCRDGIKRVDVRSNGTWTVNWTAAGIPGSPITGPGAVYSLAGGRLYAINGATGRTISSIAVGSTTRFATPMLVGKKIYVGTTSGVTAVDVA